MSIRVLFSSTEESWYEQDVTLDGVAFKLRLMWCERERRWYLDIETGDGTAVATAIKVVASRPLTERLTSPLRPAGELWCWERTGSGLDPDLRDLGSRCALLYVDEEDVA